MRSPKAPGALPSRAVGLACATSSPSAAIRRCLLAETINEAMAHVRTGLAPRTRYFKPGDGPVAESPG